MPASGSGEQPLAVLAEYADRGSGLTILTQGSGNVVFSRPGATPCSVASFPVDARDTTGAGDAFRAGIVYGLVRGLDGEALIRTAAGVAALVCRTAPGVVHSPTGRELEAFLADLP